MGQRELDCISYTGVNEIDEGTILRNIARTLGLNHARIVTSKEYELALKDMDTAHTHKAWRECETNNASLVYIGRLAKERGINLRGNVIAP